MIKNKLINNNRKIQQRSLQNKRQNYAAVDETQHMNIET